MALVLNGDGNVTGLTPGGLPDASITQADLAANVVGKGLTLCKQHSANTSLTAGTWTKVAYNSTQWDTDSLWDGTNNYVIPNVAGWYLCTMNSMTTNSGITVIAIRKNLSEEWGTVGWNTVNTSSQSTSVVIYCNGTTDYLSGWIYSSNNNTMTGYPWQNSFSVTLIRRA